nr:reverse transcriptase domain-containing protein [Tanacetum cinerariifolium]
MHLHSKTGIGRTVQVKIEKIYLLDTRYGNLPKQFTPSVGLRSHLSSNGSAKGWFECLPANNINEWSELREVFAARYFLRRACFKEPHKITRIVRKVIESLTAFKERWTVETGFIIGVLEVMKIVSFMDSLKLFELSKHFSNKVPIMVEEMMTRVDDIVRSEEAFAAIELPKGETEGTSLEIISFDDPEARLHLVKKASRNGIGVEKTKLPGEGRYANGQRKSKRRSALLGKDNQYNKDSFSKGKEEKSSRSNRGLDEHSHNFPHDIIRRCFRGAHNSGNREDVLEEPIIVETEVEGYLVRRVDVDQGSLVKVIFEYYFENLSPGIKARLKETQTNLVGFAREVTNPLGKIELEVCFGNEGLCRRKTMKFTIIRAPSPYNVILGRKGLKL